MIYNWGMFPQGYLKWLLSIFLVVDNVLGVSHSDEATELNLQLLGFTELYSDFQLIFYPSGYSFLVLVHSQRSQAVASRGEEAVKSHCTRPA